jgi:hypothetical protein
VLTTALTWGVGWAAAAGLLHPAAVLLGESGLLGQGLVQDVVFSGFIGFFSGAVFASGLALSEHRMRLDQVRVLAGTLWGAAAGFAGPASLALLIGDFGDYLRFAAQTPLFVVTLTALGAASGAVMTGIAKRSDAREIGHEGDVDLLGR